MDDTFHMCVLNCLAHLNKEFESFAGAEMVLIAIFGEGIHPLLDNLYGDFSSHWLLLFGHVNNSHAPFTDPLKQLVAFDDRSVAIREAVVSDPDRRVQCRRCQEFVVDSIGFKQLCYTFQQV